MGLIEVYNDQIQRLCKSYKVKTLYSFGSINTVKFNTTSDVDLLVDFQATDPLEYSDNYFDLKFGLESLFNRPIDLLESKAIRNPYLKESIDKSKVLVYG